MKLVTLAGAGVFLLVVAAIAVVAAPEVRGQVLRERPAVHFRTLLHGGSAIGVELRDVDEADVRREQLPALSGAVVVEVAGSSPAADAGFRAGDVVVTFDQERVRSARHLSRLIDETPAGR
jgi:S1-C subfamily serine protease